MFGPLFLQVSIEVTWSLRLTDDFCTLSEYMNLSNLTNPHQLLKNNSEGMKGSNVETIITNNTPKTKTKTKNQKKKKKLQKLFKRE